MLFRSRGFLREGEDTPVAFAAASAARSWNGTKIHAHPDNVIVSFVEARLPDYVRDAIYDAVPTLPRYVAD